MLFLACLGVCTAGIIGSLWSGLPADVIGRAALVALGVGLHCLAFVTPVAFRSKLPGKEIGVGLFFALGAYTCLGAAPSMLPLFGSIAAVVAFVASDDASAMHGAIVSADTGITAG